jgi:subtilisin-like proprotein convertase family protein
MHTARDPKRRSWSLPSRNGRTGPRAGESLVCEALEPRLLLTGNSPFDTVQHDADQALVSSADYDPIVQPYVVSSLHAEEALPLAGSASPGGYTPQQVRHAYGFDQIFFEGGSIVGDGAGQTIAIVNAYHTANALTDLQSFDAYFGLPDPPSFVQVGQTGGATPIGTDSGWALETALDVQWIHALAPAANIVLVEANSSQFSDLMVAVDHARSRPDVSIVSMSFGTAGEFSGETGYDFHFTTPVNHAGVTFFAAAGNSGGPGGYPAYSPNVVAVGGTTMSLSLDGFNNIGSETAWSGSGGGISQYEPQPSWQNGVVTQTATQRAMPDVSFDANPSTGVPVWDTFNNNPLTPWTKVGGTSFATPAWGALVAIANQGRSLAGLPVFDTPTLMNALYTMPQSNFNDITSGSSGGSAPQTAVPGYDPVTGRGTPKAQLVVASLTGNALVGGKVFNDANGNGTLDSEAGLAGWMVYADLNNNGAFDTTQVNTYSASSPEVPKTISGFGTSTITSNISVAGLAANILDVNVTLNITHANDSDLVITLIAPDGSEYVLANHVGGTGDNFSNTKFDDSAPTAIASGTAPFSSTSGYRPSTSLAGLFARNPNGTWQLRIQDTTFFNGGTLNAWSLEIKTGDASAVSGADGAYWVNGLRAGTYQIREVPQAPYAQTGPVGGFYSVNLTAGQNAAGRDFGNQLPVSSAPAAPVLLAVSDTGVSSSDGITKLNNASAPSVLQFQVSGTIAGATVTIEAGGTTIGTAIASGSTTTVVTNGSTTLADGVRSITARQTVPGQSISAPSAPLAITIDTTAPVSSIMAVVPNPRTTPLDEMTVLFNEPVFGLALGALDLTRNFGPDLLSGAQSINSLDGGLTWTLHNLTSITLLAGFYELLLTPSLSGTIDVAGNVPLGTSASFTVSASVVGRRLFYNQSAFDGNDAAINALDDSAIATDKSAYLPGAGLAGFQNVSSYTRGINGIMIDVANALGTLTSSDFTFKVGNSNTPGSWSAAPAPLQISVRAGAGQGGSDRVEIIWANGAIKNTWLEVIVEGNDATGGFNTNTGLAASDVFFFGNRVGDSGIGTPATFFESSITDAASVFGNLTGNAGIENLFDYDRNGSVTVGDAAMVFGSLGTLARINIGSGGPFAPEAADGGAASAIAAALAAPLPQLAESRTSSGTWAQADAGVSRPASPPSPKSVAVASAALPAGRDNIAPLQPSAVDVALDDALLDALLIPLWK